MFTESTGQHLYLLGCFPPKTPVITWIFDGTHFDNIDGVVKQTLGCLGHFFGLMSLHPGRLTWNLQITHLERNMIFQTSMLMFHVNLQGCTLGLSWNHDSYSP